MARFVADYRGIGQMLRADFMREDMVERARAVKELAERIAPTGEELATGWYKRQPDSRPSEGAGDYKDSFVVSSGTAYRAGGLRAYARVTNTEAYASAVEYGFRNTPRYRILGRALAAAGGDLRPELTY